MSNRPYDLGNARFDAHALEGYSFTLGAGGREIQRLGGEMKSAVFADDGRDPSPAIRAFFAAVRAAFSPLTCDAGKLRDILKHGAKLEQFAIDYQPPAIVKILDVENDTLIVRWDVDHSDGTVVSLLPTGEKCTCLDLAGIAKLREALDKAEAAFMQHQKNAGK